MKNFLITEIWSSNLERYGEKYSPLIVVAVVMMTAYQSFSGNSSNNAIDYTTFISDVEITKFQPLNLMRSVKL